MNKRELSKINRHKALKRWSDPVQIEAARIRMGEAMRRYWDNKKAKQATEPDNRHI